MNLSHYLSALSVPHVCVSAQSKASALRALYDELPTPGVRMSLGDYTEDEVELEDIQADKRGRGLGTKAMNRLVMCADLLGVDLFLVPAGYGTRKFDRLVEFYERFGFELDGEDTMRREARNNGSAHATAATDYLYHASFDKITAFKGPTFFSNAAIAESYASSGLLYKCVVSVYHTYKLGSRYNEKDAQFFKDTLLNGCSFDADLFDRYAQLHGFVCPANLIHALGLNVRSTWRTIATNLINNSYDSLSFTDEHLTNGTTGQALFVADATDCVTIVDTSELVERV